MASTTEAPLQLTGIPWRNALASRKHSGHLRPCIKVLASPIVIAHGLTPRGSTVLLLHVEVPLIIPLPLGTPLLVEVIVSLFHRSSYVDRSVV